MTTTNGRHHEQSRNGRPLRILVGLHHLELGGSQLNALDLATAMRDRGHEVRLIATYQEVPGPVADLAAERQLPLCLIQHPLVRTRDVAVCRLRVARAMASQVTDFSADVVHAYEYSHILDALYGPALRWATPVVGTVYGMGVPSWLPRRCFLTLGTPELVAEAREMGFNASLLLPPVDVGYDDPALIDGPAFRRSLRLRTDDVLAVIVSRLEPDMKEEGVARSIAALRQLDNPRLRLLIVGDGPSYERLRAQASGVNTDLGRGAVMMYGAMVDPRPAYAAADITLGMGGSALRGMAFGKPLIVLGINGFSLPFDTTTAEHFHHAGFFGTQGTDTDQLPGQIKHLLEVSRRTHGDWNRQFVRSQYSLERAAEGLEQLYRSAVAAERGRPLASAARTAVHRTAAELTPDSVRKRVRPVTRAVMRLHAGMVHQP